MKQNYNIVATINENGNKWRKVCPLGALTVDALTEFELMAQIIKYCNSLIKTLTENGHRVVDVEDGEHLCYRKVTLSNGSSISVTTEMA